MCFIKYINQYLLYAGGRYGSENIHDVIESC